MGNWFYSVGKGIYLPPYSQALFSSGLVHLSEMKINMSTGPR